MAKRFQTYFGVPIPPFKEQKLGAGATTIRFIITGDIPSKKNNSMAVTIRSDARYFIKAKAKNGMISVSDANSAISRVRSKMRGNQEYQKWILEQKPIILDQMHFWLDKLQDKGLVYPLHKAIINTRFYFNNNYSIDILNKLQSVQDLLVDCKVIQDDNYSVVNPINAGAANYKDELVKSICFVSISFKI